MDVSDAVLDRIGRLFVDARDATISNYDRYTSDKPGGKYGQFINGIYQGIGDDSKEAFAALLPCIVDETLRIVLQLLDERLDRILLKVEEEGVERSPYDFTDALEAEYDPEDGWVHRFSQQRIVEMERDF
ncbi:hypothetical protein [Deinococcus sp. QL22]|uniref:hypothetical protein n=1 Tax=Deinococcus sp. QL22 TaxID=2939437 RepID=UPI002017C0FB|nr:hypothetical protein [Deinococcus sp. QL22]UQN05164.1 hypothetical protein M1R55_09685 [Deinococcus sp. QL22]